VTCGASFNPRARVGRDGMFRPKLSRRQEVSIHAPAWGATSGPIMSTAVSTGFNPRARVGRDEAALYKKRKAAGFNPRARVGRDPCPLALDYAQTVSIHAPAWGATSRKSRERWRYKVSIHAPAWGATYRNPNKFNIFRFQSTRPRGARPLRASIR